MPYGEGNPQLEDGFARIANEILDAIARTTLTDYESRCIHYLWRKTYGWHNKSQPEAKKEDIISYSQWATGTAIERRALRRVLANLVGRHIFMKNSIKLEGKNAITVWAFQKRYLKWGGYIPIQSSLELGAPQPPPRQEEGASQPPPRYEVGAAETKVGAPQPPPRQEEGASQPPPRYEVGAAETKVGAPQPPQVGAPQPPTIDNIDNTIDKEEEETLAVFKTMPGWKSQQDEDLVWLKDLTHDFPNITILKVKACRDFWSTQPAKHKGQWKNRLRNWLTKDLAPKKGFTAANKPPPGKIATQEELGKWNQ